MERDGDQQRNLYSWYARARFSRQFDFALQAYSALGLLISFLATGYLILSSLPFDLTGEQWLAAGISGLGVTLALMSQLLRVLRHAREEEESERFKEHERLLSFLRAWSEFEAASKDALRRTGKEFDSHSLRSIISRLQHDGKISESDVVALEEALDTRNALVHGGRPLPSAAVKRLTDFLVEVIGKLSFGAAR